jgi:pSer/pThr/pTyr-binding forkhead associated (FHA) protein
MTFDSTGDGAATSETIEIEVGTRGGRLVLEIQDDEEVRRVPLVGAPLVLGSGKACDVVVRDRTVSSRHCEFAVHEGRIVVRDLGSRNGTYVGGARTERAWGGEGMTVLIGRTTIVCLGPRESEEDDDGAEGNAPDAIPASGPTPYLEGPLPGIAGRSIAMSRVASQVRRLARLSAPVLIAGETGVGKELVARALHAEGLRGDGPFVAINVAALPRELVESELFGHERGAFTGAVTKRSGAFTEAEGGTLFLDEIGELPIDAQPKLLRALDGYEVRRVGAAGSGQRSDARVVAATHVPLLEQVRAGRFRRDLFHRLEVFVVDLPPLRARRGDILGIAKTLLGQMESEIGERSLTPSATAQLMAYDWPGNVRELRNVLLRAADLSGDQRAIDTRAVLRAIRRKDPAALELTPDDARSWLDNHKGNVSAAARAAGISRTSFRRLLGQVVRAGDAAAQGQ